MLTALERGVKGGKWFSLIDKVYNQDNLTASWEKVRSNRGSSGVDKQTIQAFADGTPGRIVHIAEELKTGTYQAQAIRRVYIPKPGRNEKRPLGIPTVRDRIVQTALRNVIEPIFERKFANDSYGYRSQRGAKDALRRVQQLLNEGHTWVVDADIEKCFDTIDQTLLMEDVTEEISDGKVLELLQQYLQQPILGELDSWAAEAGTPQGAVISPLLANIYLHLVDVAMQAAGFNMVRYADDLVVLCRTQAEAESAMELLRRLITERRLHLHTEKTKIVDAAQRGGFDFLGYHFEGGHRWPSKKSMTKLHDAIRPKTKRSNGQSLATIVTELNPVLRGRFNYFKHSHSNTFPPIDGMVRMRLRSILRKRHGGKGQGRGSDHERWPNQYFRGLDLFTMTQTHRTLCHSSS